MQNGDIYWMDAAYPHVLEEMLFNENEDGIDHDSDSDANNESDFYGSDVDSEEETDD